MATMSKCLQLVDRISDQDRDEILRRIDELRATEMPPEVAQVRAVMDALEAAQREAVTSSPAFKEWFGSSKVVDEDGKPKVLYHGTAGDFSTFIPGGLEPTMSGPAIWLSPDADHQPAAHNIGGRGRYRDGTNVMPVYVRMERPLLIDDMQSLEWAREVFAGGSAEFPQLLPKSWADEVTRDGEYDGIIFDGEALGWGKGSTEYIVFDPTQVKSAIGNNGQFSRQNPDIRLSPERTPKKNFGRIVPYAQEAYKKLSPKAANAVDSWNVNWSNGQLEMAFRNGTPLADEIRAAFEPVREQLRKVFGDTITLYRGERTGPLDDEKRTLLSWTPVRSLAKMFAVGREGEPLSDKEIEEAVAQYERIGFAQVRGNRFMRNKNNPEFFDIYNRNRQPVTDGTDLGRMLRDDQREQLEDAAERRQGKSLYTAEVPVDDIVWIPLGANLTQPEMIATYNPRARDAESLKFSPSRDQTETPEFKRWFGDSKVVDNGGDPLIVYRGVRGQNEIADGALNAAPRAGYASFGSDSPSVAATYGMPTEDSAEAGAITPLYIKADKLIEFPVTVDRYGYRKFDKYEFDRKAQSLRQGEVLVARQVVDIGPQSPEAYKVDPAKKYTYYSDVYAWGPGTSVKSAIGNRGTFDPDNPDIRFSTSRLDAIRDMQLPAGYRVADLLDSSKKVSWWDKSVGTMYHLAEKHPAFKRVYDAIQNFIGDVSTYATRAADMAPSILPKLEYMRDIFKSPVAPEDVKALAGPIFEGTLRYTRDQNGNAVETQDVGLAGVVWREDELRGKWKLNDRQIGLYREFRRATNKSISDLAITDMLRYAGDDAAGVRAQALRANGVRHARDIIVEELMKMAAANPNRAQLLGESIQVIKEKANSAMGLIAKGYAPLSRYGDYTVYVTQGDEQIYFGMFETQREANKMARQMREQHPNADVATGTMSKESYKLFSGVSPETLALFGEAMGLEDSATDEQKQVFDRYLKLAKSNRSTMKRLIERKGIDGFSEDFGRVLAGFVYSNARQASTNLHAGEIGRSVYAIKQGGPQNGDLLDQAVKLMQYVQNGQEEAQAIRGLLFAQYIGGSLASAMTNLTQSLTTTWPTLSMHFGIGNSGRALTDALRIVKSNGAGDPVMQAALKRAEEDGITAPQEVHHLMAQAAGRGSLQTGDGTKVGDTLAKISNTAAKVQFAWGKAFGWAEQLNRKVAFAAAFSLARDKGMPDPFGFATKIVSETQYVMNKGNNPNWARGAVGATLFTFKKFMVNYLEGLARMWGNGPEGKKAFALSLAILWMLAGFGGMPGGEDLDDLIDAFAQRVLDKNFSTKQAKREFFTEIFGKAGADFVMSGFSGLPGVPLDVSGRLGLGNIVPGTGILTKKTDHSSDVKEIGGAAADFVSRMLTGVGQVAQGDFSNAVQSFAPVAAGNAYKAMEMARLGYYKDQKNRKVVDTDLADAVLKGIGFQPRAVAQVQEAVRSQQQLIALNKLRETEIADLWTRGRVERNPEMVEDAKRQLEEWNRDNPDSPIEIDASQISRRVREANMSKAQRIAKSAPKEIRKAVEERLRSIE